MNEWQTVELSTVADLSGGYAFKSEEYTESGMFILRTLNIRDDCGIERDNPKFISLSEVDNYKRFLLQANDTLFVLVGATLGKIGFVRSCDLPAVLNQNMWRIRAKPNHIDSLYLHYCFQHFSKKPLEWISGSARGFATRDDYRKLEIPLPAIFEQREIAALLGTLDDKIELNRKTAGTLEEMARALYRSWFVDFDPVRARAEGRAPAHMDAATADLFPNSFGEDGLPVGWKVGSLGQVSRNSRSTVDPSAISSETPYVGLEHIPRRSIYIGEWGVADDVGSAKSTMKKGQFLFGKLRPYFHKVGLVPVDGICSTDILVVEAKLPIWSEFVLSVISSVELVDHVNAASTGTRMPRARWQDLAAYQIAVASDAVVRRFSKIVWPTHDRILLMVQENRTLAALRDTLLPRLMSGELRVNAARDMVEKVA